MKTSWGPLPHFLLQFAPDEQVEQLVGAAELHVGLDGDGVVRLQQRVEHLGDRDGPLPGVPCGKVVAVQELVDGEVRREPYDVGERELPEPLALVHGARPVRVHDLEELAHVRLGVLAHVLGAEHRARVGLAGRVADLRRPVADDEDELVTEVLQLSQFPETDVVAEVQVRSAGVEPHLETERLPLLQTADELVLRDDLRYAALRDAVDGLLIECGHIRTPPAGARGYASCGLRRRAWRR